MPAYADDLISSARNTITFLRMTAIELRRFAYDTAWSVADADRLCHIAAQCDKDADALLKGLATTE